MPGHQLAVALGQLFQRGSYPFLDGFKIQIFSDKTISLFFIYLSLSHCHTHARLVRFRPILLGGQWLNANLEQIGRSQRRDLVRPPT